MPFEGGACRAVVRNAVPPPEAAAAAGSAEVPIQGDLGVEDLRHRAVLLRRPGQLLELAPVDARDLTFQRQRRLADLEALSLFLEAHGRLGRELARSEARALQLKSERHGEAARMSGRDQLLGIRALLVLEARLEGIGRVGQDARVGRERAVAVLAGTAPESSRFADHDRLLGWPSKHRQREGGVTPRAYVISGGSPSITCRASSKRKPARARAARSF